MKSDKQKDLQKSEKRPVSSSNENSPADYMTMSQWQNRYGKGRERNGSDGSNERAGRLHH